MKPSPRLRSGFFLFVVLRSGFFLFVGTSATEAPATWVEKKI
jgi:hypothetical protein